MEWPEEERMPELDQDWPVKIMRSDSEFLRKVGIKPCVLNDPFPKRPSSLESEGPEIPPLTEHDDRWLRSCGATWEPEPEPGFRPPASSLEYLARYPDRIRETVDETAKDLLIELPEGRTFDDFLQEVIADFVEGSKQGDDLARMYANSRPSKPGTCKSAHFHALVKHFVEGITMTLYPPPIPDPDSARNEEEQHG
jgi:hypothetical protein